MVLQFQSLRVVMCQTGTRTSILRPTHGSFKHFSMCRLAGELPTEWILYWYVPGYFNKKLGKKAFQKQEITDGMTLPRAPILPELTLRASLAADSGIL